MDHDTVSIQPTTKNTYFCLQSELHKIDRKGLFFVPAETMEGDQRKGVPSVLGVSYHI